MDLFVNLLKKPFFKRIIALIIIGLVLILMKSQLSLLLLTFIFVFLVDSVQKHISKWLSKFVYINSKIIIISLYLIIAGVLFMLFYVYVPEIIEQMTNIIASITYFILNFKDLVNTDNVVLSYIYDYLQKIDIANYVKSNGTAIINIISNVGNIVINILMASLLSLFFLLEKSKIRVFLKGFEHSKIDWIYDELKYFGGKFTNSFGKVIQAQILISFINSTISIITLSFLQLPNIVGLFFMIFILGMVPVAGVIISIVPLSIISYSVGGFRYVIYMMILIVVLHTIESYILNPKLMSHNTKMPVFVIFLILIFSQHFLGPWGLIVGIPITLFILDILDVKVTPPSSENLLNN